MLLHGIRTNAEIWTPVAAQLRTRRGVLAVDLPGHGSRRSARFTLDDAAVAVLRAVDELGGRALVAGHSLGGAVAMRTAATDPRAVAGLVGIGCTIPPGGGMLRPAYRVIGYLFQHHAEAADRWSTAVFRRLLPSSVLEPALAAGMAPEAVPPALAAMAAFDAAAELRGYPGPVWLVNGGLDQFRLGEQSCLRACVDGRLEVWPRLNHISVMGEVHRLVTLIDDACTVVETR